MSLCKCKGILVQRDIIAEKYFQEKINMKKLVILATMILITVTATLSNAQCSIGVIGGLNFSDMKAETEIRSRTLTGFGLLLEYKIIDQFSIVSLPMYIQNGGIKPRTEDEPEMTVTGTYLDFPIFFKYILPFPNIVKPFLFAGPSLQYKLDSKMEGTLLGFDITADLNDVTNDFDFGLSFGAGVEIPLDILSIVIEGKYYLGLVDQHKDGPFQVNVAGLTIEGEFDQTNHFKNRGIQILAGITFPIGN